ncbi:hypothetical protein ABBQ38_007531 [Trebouxia sp. C0009 RCD-2024]
MILLFRFAWHIAVRTGDCLNTTETMCPALAGMHVTSSGRLAVTNLPAPQTKSGTQALRRVARLQLALFSSGLSREPPCLSPSVQDDVPVGCFGCDPRTACRSSHAFMQEKAVAKAAVVLVTK